MGKGTRNTDDIGRVTVGVGRGADKVSIREAAALLGVHPNTVRHRVKIGVYKAEKETTKHGPTWLIDRASLGSNTSVREPERLAERSHEEPAQGTGQARSSGVRESSVKPRWRRWVFAPFRLLAWPLVALYKWLGGESKSAKFAVRISEVAALIALFVAALSWLHDAPQRQLESELEAWQVIDAAKGAQTSSARIIALQFLNDAGVSLNGLALSNANLSGIELANADLRDVELSKTNLVGADLAGANLKGADLKKANLSEADLSEANLNGKSKNGKTNLDGANMFEADLSGADLRGASLRGAKPIGANLEGAYLNGADLRDADLRSADLIGAEVADDASLWGADLRRVDLTYAKVRKGQPAQSKSYEGATMPNGSKHH